jgi:hypothetical protein
MPTYIAYVQRPYASAQDLSDISAFLIIGILQLAIVILSGGQWAPVGEQLLW